jgi:hypothetical protein
VAFEFILHLHSSLHSFLRIMLTGFIHIFTLHPFFSDEDQSPALLLT